MRTSARVARAAAKPVRVMYLADGYAGPHAGTEGQMLQLMQGLDRSRYEPTLALLRPSAYIERSGWPCPVQVLGVGRLASLGSLARVVRHAARERARGCRIVHCYFNDTSLLAPIFRLMGMRVVVSRRDMGFWHTGPILAALRVAAPFVDRYVANSRAVGEMVRRVERVPPRKIAVIHNGYAPRAGGPSGAAALAGLPPGVPVVGLVANLRPVKRIDTLIEAVALLRAQQPDLRAVIVGGDGEAPSGGTMREQLAALAERLGVAGQVVFAGRSGDPSGLIDRFDVAVLCSESEGLSNAIIEYMQAARPVVCTATGGNPELIEDGQSGFLVPVGDAGALAARIGQLLADRALAKRLGQAAQRAMRSRFSEARMLAEQMACYDGLDTGRAARAPGALGRLLARARGC